jgi:hypothetical protein
MSKLNPIVAAYSDNGANQLGGDLPYFVGKQYGSGWLRTLARVAFPILRRVVGAAGNAAQDVIYNNRSVGEAVRDSAINEVTNFVNSRKPPPEQTQNGVGSHLIRSINTRAYKKVGTKRKRMKKSSSSSFPIFAKKHKK